MSYDLIVMPPRGALLPLNEGRQLVDDFRKETHLDGRCEITDFMREPIGLPSDPKALEESFRKGEFSRGEYETFCSAHQLTPEGGERHSRKAARLFLDKKWGQHLMSLKLPPAKMVDDVREAYRLIVEFARRHKLVVKDPQLGAEIDLGNPGEFPPMW